MLGHIANGVRFSKVASTLFALLLVAVVLEMVSSIVFCFLFKTGFNEDRNFHVVSKSIIASRYHVTGCFGSAVFSKFIRHMTCTVTWMYV